MSWHMLLVFIAGPVGFFVTEQMLRSWGASPLQRQQPVLDITEPTLAATIETDYRHACCSKCGQPVVRRSKP